MWRERGRRVTGAKSLSGLLRLAGNGDFAACSPVQRSVCPRSRGEQWRSICARRAACGLSPLARGTALNAMWAEKLARFIPARAVYPRSRGLSPLARGTGLSISALRFSAAVYPRSRGEQLPYPPSDPHPPGLSPLARGTGQQLIVRRLRRRFIPARAGNRRVRKMPIETPTVYPRSRGEQESLQVR